MYNASYTAQATNIWPLSSTPERFSNSNALIRQYRSSLPLPCSDQFVLQIPAQIPGQICLPCSTFVCGPRDGKHWLSGFVGASRVTEYKQHYECNYPQEMTETNHLSQVLTSY